jgi:hypothetical protein
LFVDEALGLDIAYWERGDNAGRIASERPLDCLLPGFCVILTEQWGNDESVAWGSAAAHTPYRAETGRSVAGLFCGFRDASDQDVCLGNKVWAG